MSQTINQVRRDFQHRISRWKPSLTNELHTITIITYMHQPIEKGSSLAYPWWSFSAVVNRIIKIDYH